MSTVSFAIATESAAGLHPRPLLLLCPPGQLYLDARVRKVQLLMQHRLHVKLSLRELAAAVSLSASRFSHLFKIQTGISPAQYLKSMRLQKAGDLLEGSHLSIKEVAVHVGLNPSRFSESFRKIHGVTPLQYRFAALRTQSNPRLPSDSYSTARDRDRGSGRPLTPPTPPYVRITYTAVP